jgi:hypothetical protein
MFLTEELAARAFHVYPQSADSPDDGSRSGKPTDAPLEQCAFCQLGQCDQTFVDEGVGLVVHNRRVS